MGLFGRLIGGKSDAWLIEKPPRKTGRTPRWIRHIVEDAIKDSFNGVNSPRGDQALFVSRTAAKLLKELGVASRVVAGSARWDKFPIGFIYKGRAEFHAWVETEFDEIVDLTCDDLHHRAHLPVKVPKGPKSCWDPRTKIKKRKYEEVPSAAKDCGVFGSVAEELISLPERAATFVEEQRPEYERRYPGS